MHVKIEGLAAMTRDLNALDKKVRKKVVRAAVGKTIRAVAKDVKARVPVLHKRLRKSITTKLKYRDNFAEGIIAARKGGGGGTFHLSEFGTAGRIQKSTGRRTGSMPARPALRPAMQHAGDLLAGTLKKEFDAVTGAR